jgi:DNA topoisomerase IB
LSSGSSSARVRARVRAKKNYLIVDGQQRVLSLLLLLIGWSIRVGDKEYTRQPVSFNPTKYVLEVGKRGLDLSEGMKAQFGLKDVDVLKREYIGEYVDRLLDLCERIASYRIPAYFMDLDDEESPLERAAEIFILANRAGQRITNVELMLSYES